MPSARPQLQSKNVDDQTWLLSFVLHTHRRSKDLLLPAWATSSFTTVAGQGWLVGLAEPALDAGTTLAYHRVRRQGGIDSLDRDGLFEQEIGAQEHDRSSRGPRKVVSRFGRLRTSGSRVSQSQKSRMNSNARLRAYDARQHALARRSLRHRGVH